MFEFLEPLFGAIAEGVGSLFGGGGGEAIASALPAAGGDALGAIGGALGEAGAGLGELGTSALGFADTAGSAAAGAGETAFGAGASAVPFQNVGQLGSLSGVSESGISGVNSLFDAGAGASGASGAATSGAATGAATAAKAAPSFFDNIVSGATSSVTKNPLGIGAAAAGLGMNLLRGNPTDPNQKMLQATATQLGAQGQVFQNYLATGTLPPAMQAQLSQATDAAKARIIANHASNGMPTDPSQNSALAQELSAVDMNAVAAMAKAQMDMLNTGLNETGLSTQLYETLVKMDKQNNTDLLNAISSFAGALGGGSKGTTIQLKAA